MSILVVEDNRGTRNALDLWLTRLGYESILCHDAEEGMHRFKEMIGRGDPVEMLLTDYLLPNQSGLELIMGCRSLIPDLKVVLISGYQDKELLLKARELPRCRFLAKPFTSEDLRQTFEQLEQEDVF